MSDDFDRTKKGLSIVSLILGIVGFFWGYIPVVGMIAPAFPILAIIFAAISLKKKQVIKGLAVAGLVLGIVSLGFSIIVLALVGVLAIAVLSI